MDNLKGLLGIRKMSRVPNLRISESYGMTKSVNERTDESVLRRSSHTEEWGMIECLNGYM